MGFRRFTDILLNLGGISRISCNPTLKTPSIKSRPLGREIVSSDETSHLSPAQNAVTRMQRALLNSQAIPFFAEALESADQLAWDRTMGLIESMPGSTNESDRLHSGTSLPCRGPQVLSMPAPSNRGRHIFFG